VGDGLLDTFTDKPYDVPRGGSMVRSTAFVGLIALVVSGTAAAQQSGFGLGIILGEPTGINFKLWIGRSSALDGAAAWSLERRSSLHLHMDYLMHSFDIFRVRTGRLPVYYGIGGRIKFREDDDDSVGLRIPVGIDYLFARAPLDVFAEIVPLLDLTPNTDFSLNGGAGIRYFFW